MIMSVARTKLLPTSLVAMILAMPLPVWAQRAGEVMVPGGVMPSGTMPAVLSPSDTLAQNLRILASNPRDVTALTQAGISALAVGDPNAALGFLARAEQLSPTNGRVKAALGSVMVMMERPGDAMPFFSQALALGIPEMLFAKDRGLAFDLLGDPRAAQRDYTLALRQGRDPETVRRMALSLGVTGAKDQALTMLDPLIRQQDQAAWRARAFILAMTGDQKGADRIIQQVAPPEMVGTMSSFLRRLPSLSVAARASAVNFGTMPASGPVYATQASTNSMRAIPVSMTDSLTHQEAAVASPVALSDDNSRKSRRANRRRPDRDMVAEARPVESEPAPAFDDRAERDTRRDRKLKTRDEKVAALNALYDQGRSPAAAPTSAPAPRTAAPIQQVAMVTPRPAPEPLPTREDPPEPVFEISAAPVAVPVAARPIQSAALARPAPAVMAAPAPRPVVTAPVVASPVAVVQPSPAVVAPIVTAPPAPAPVPAMVAPRAPAPGITVPVSTPAPAPAVISPPIVAPSPVPVPPPSVPSQIALVEARPAVAAAAPAPTPVAQAATRVGDMVATSGTAPVPVQARPTAVLMGPPVPEGVSAVQLAPTPRPAPTPAVAPPAVATPPVQLAAAPAAEPIAAAPVETITQAVPAAPDATPVAAPVEEKGLESLLNDLTPEAERPAGAVLGDAEFRKARAVAKKKADAEAKVKAAEEAEALAKKEEEEAKKRELAKHPARYWVQVGTGNSKGGAAPTIRKVREQAGDTLSRYGSATVPWKATQRLLVGPFGSEAEAKKAVSALGKKGVNATTFASSQGQEVSKLATK
jgi:Flp pilus assembly protein TadD